MGRSKPLRQHGELYSRWLKGVLFLGLLGLAILSVARGVARHFSDSGGFDIHAYWYAGHFVRQGENPYRAFLDRVEPQAPVRYLDGAVVESLPIRRPGMSTNPANTPPLILVLTLLAYFSWPVGKTLWFGVNVGAMLLVPWLVKRWLPAGYLSRYQFWLLFLTFLCFSGPRVALWIGQVTLVVLVLMLLSVIWGKNRPVLAGIALGIALSKPTVAGPVLLYALYRRQWRMVLVSMLVQLGALLLLAGVTAASPITIVADLLRAWNQFIIQPGIHLAQLLPPHPLLQIAVLFLLTLLTGIGLWWGLHREQPRLLAPGTYEWQMNHLLTSLLLWGLLVVYHGGYDTAIAVVYGAILLAWLGPVGKGNLSGRGRAIILVLLVFFWGIMIMPGEIVGVFLPAGWLPVWIQLANLAMTFNLLLGLGVTIWLMEHIRREHLAKIDPANGTVAYVAEGE